MICNTSSLELPDIDRTGPVAFVRTWRVSVDGSLLAVKETLSDLRLPGSRQVPPGRPSDMAEPVFFLSSQAGTG